MFGANKVLLRQDKKCDPLTLAVTAMVVGTGYSIYSGMQAADAQKEAQKMQQRQSEVSEQRKRIQAAREAAIQRENLLMTGENLGIGQSSGVAGGTASIGSQSAERIGYSNVMEGFARYTSQANQEAASWQSQSQIGQGIASIGSTIFSAQGGFNKQAGIKSYPPTGTIFSNTSGVTPSGFNWSY